MATIESSIHIARSVDIVFAFITNLENQKALQPGITQVILNGPLAIGTRYTLKGQVMGRDFSVENEIVSFEPNKKLGVKTLTSLPSSPMTNTYTLTPEGSSTCLTTSMDAVIMGGFPGMEDMVKNQLKASLDGANATLKKVLES
jgi:carbon monoxide dehydrogenase subunit G